MASFRKILVANRGEIACRVLRTAELMGYETVAVYSDADQDAMHVRRAHEAVRIGPGPATESYLRKDAVLEAARATCADAIHPGYGFLAESAAFAGACETLGLTFVGPPAEAISIMGDKAQAKERMQQAGVSTLPGFWADGEVTALSAAAEQLGYPLLLKATAGGGGRGIRLVRCSEELEPALAAAQLESESAFGDRRIMLEKLVSRARHIEVQIVADAHGQVIQLGERDCSTQRRRQKLIEESPAPGVSASLRRALGEAAVRAARAVHYRGVGTVEFLVDQNEELFFLEMNTRLQVEHAVTELVTGLDLVRLQFEVAEGKPLGFTQEDVSLDGHAIEARLCAEDPYADFAPQSGTVDRFDWQAPSQALAVRVDSGVEADSSVPPFYDSLLAKLIAHAPTRDEAARRLSRALATAPLFGVKTNARLLADVLRSEPFRAATVHTGLLEQWQNEEHPLFTRPTPSDEAWALAACGILFRTEARRPFALAGATGAVTLACDGHVRSLRYQRTREDVRVQTGRAHIVLCILERDATRVRLRLHGSTREVPWLVSDHTLQLAWDGTIFAFQEEKAEEAANNPLDPRSVRAPLAGVLLEIMATAGKTVAPGETLAVIEAMKMHTQVLAPSAGKVQTAHCEIGQHVAAGDLLFELEQHEKKG